MPAQVLFARQPIFDRQQRVFAYELLFRNGEADRARFIDGDLATTSVLLNAYSENSAPQLLNGHPGFLNVGRSMFASVPVFARHFLVVEVLEHDHQAEGLIEEIEQLRYKGFRIALDDFSMADYDPGLLSRVDYVKLDVLAYSDAELADAVSVLQQHDVALLAEKVETHDMFHRCLALGFQYFQGYFFCHPELVRGKQVDSNRQSIFELLATLHDPSADISQIISIVQRDAVLSYKLLKLVNSSFFRRAQQVESIPHAVMMLGLVRIRSWATLVSMGKLTHKPDELQTESLLRAHMCEFLAQKQGAQQAPVGFAAGLLSCLDAWFDLPITELLDTLPLSTTLIQALTEKSGPIGEILAMVIKYMHTQWHDITEAELSATVLTLDDLSEAYAYAVERTDHVSNLFNQE